MVCYLCPEQITGITSGVESRKACFVKPGKSLIRVHATFPPPTNRKSHPMSRNIQSLPKWAQEKILRLMNEHTEMRHRLAAAQAANEICSKMEWSTVGGPLMLTEPRRLYLLEKDGATWVCTVGPGDILLIGRRTDNSTDK